MPSEAQIREEIGPAVRTLQIIVVAIAFGLLTFLGVAVYMSATGQFRPPNDEPREMLTWLSLACAGMAVVMHLVIPSMMVSTARRGMLEQSMQARGGKASEVISWFAVYQVRTIMAVAILEGAGFFLSIAHLMEGRPESAGAAVVILALILTRLPTAPRVAEWIETQMRHA